MPELQALIERKEFDRALEFFLENIPQMLKGEIAKLKSSPQWTGMVELNKVAPREMGFLRQLTWTPEQLAKLRCRTWMLLGSLSLPPDGQESRVAALVDRIPGMTLYPLMSQGHVAYLSDPALLAKVAKRCLADE